MVHPIRAIRVIRGSLFLLLLPSNGCEYRLRALQIAIAFTLERILPQIHTIEPPSRKRPDILRDDIWATTFADAVGARRLTASGSRALLEQSMQYRRLALQIAFALERPQVHTIEPRSRKRPGIPHDDTRATTFAEAVGARGLTASGSRAE